MRVKALVVISVLGLAAGSEALAQGRVLLPLGSVDGPYQERDYRPGSSNEGLYKPTPSRSGTAVADLRKRTRTTFELAQAQKAEGDTAAACKSIRKAIELDRRYIERKNSVARYETTKTDESYYQAIEAEYCGAERG